MQALALAPYTPPSFLRPVLNWDKIVLVKKPPPQFLNRFLSWRTEIPPFGSWGGGLFQRLSWSS